MSWNKISKTQVRSHLKKQWKKRGGCSVCGANAWNVLDEEFLIANLAKDGPLHVAVVVCDNCGHVYYFSSDIIYEKRKRGRADTS